MADQQIPNAPASTAGMTGTPNMPGMPGGLPPALSVPTPGAAPAQVVPTTAADPAPALATPAVSPNEFEDPPVETGAPAQPTQPAGQMPPITGTQGMPGMLGMPPQMPPQAQQMPPQAQQMPPQAQQMPGMQPQMQQMPPQMQQMPPQMQQMPPQMPPQMQQQMVPQAAPTQLALPLGADGFPMGTLEETANAFGIEGINFNAFGVVPIIVLDKSEFRDSNGKSYGTSFICRVNQARKKYLFIYSYLPAGLPMHPDNMEKELMYSYDGVNDQGNSGRTLETFKAEAANLGSAVETKVYHEITVQLQDGSPANLSVPDAGSGNAWARFITEVLMRRQRPQDVDMLVSIGDKVEGPKVKFSFHPWKFTIYTPGSMQGAAMLPGQIVS